MLNAAKCLLPFLCSYLQDLEESSLGRNEAEDTIANLEERLEQVLASHAIASQQLQMATLLLQVRGVM